MQSFQRFLGYFNLGLRFNSPYFSNDKFSLMNNLVFHKQILSFLLKLILLAAFLATTAISPLSIFDFE